MNPEFIALLRCLLYDTYKGNDEKVLNAIKEIQRDDTGEEILKRIKEAQGNTVNQYFNGAIIQNINPSSTDTIINNYNKEKDEEQ
jgi:hypothetical protein